MQTTDIATISLLDLSFVLLPALLVIVWLYKWALDARSAVYALGRMFAQLLLVGYVLAYIFNNATAWLIFGILTLMVIASAWIALRTVADLRRKLLLHAVLAIAVGGCSILLLVTEAVLHTEPWYAPRHTIPLAGMIFANAMTSVSLAAERLLSELDRGVEYLKARNIAMNAAMIPVVNSLFAVGLVSLPGMMTGQILAGVSPFIAARYQIMVMCMIFASAGLAVGVFLQLTRRYFDRP